MTKGIFELDDRATRARHDHVRNKAAQEVRRSNRADCPDSRVRAALFAIEIETVCRETGNW